MPLPKIKRGVGDMPSYEPVSEGGKTFKSAPSPFFPDRPDIPVPADSRWLSGVLDDLYLRLKKTVFMVSQPLIQYPPMDHVDIDIKYTSAAIAPAGTDTLATITVPQHQVAVIRLYGQDIEAVVPPTLASSWNDIVWTFKRGRFPLQYFDAFVGQRGSPNNMRPSSIVIKGPDSFTVSVVNNSAGLFYYVSLSIVGHQYAVLDALSPREDVQI